MTQIIKSDKRNEKGYCIAANNTALMIVQSSKRGQEHVIIKPEDLEQFLADLNSVVAQLAESQKGAA